jgi:tetratricopeptide (TPR) repeat protein
MRAVLVVALLAACHHTPRPLPPLPRAAYAHYLEGKLAIYQQDWPAAVAALTAAAQAAPDQPMIAIELARAQAKAGDDAAARDTLKAARHRWDDHAQVWLASGDLLASGYPAEATGAYRRAIELDPDDERGYLGLAKVQAAREKFAEAEATLRDLVGRVPASVDGHYRLAQRLASRDDLSASVAQLRNVLEHDPDHIDARLDLARALRRQGHLDQAIEQTRSAFDRAGQDMDVAEELFWLLCEADDRQAAIDLLTLLDDDRSDTDALAVIARLDRGLGRFDEARAISDRIAKRDADAGAVALAELQIAQGDPQAAARTALAVAEGAQQFTTARRIAGEALLAAGDPRRALEVIEPARRAKPRDPDLAVLAASALADSGNADDGRKLLAGLRAAKDDLAIRIAQGRFEDHAGQPAAAIAIFEDILRARPNLVTALNQAGYLLAETNQRLDVAARYLARARMLSPGEPAILDSWGWLLLRRGNAREAIRALLQAVRFAPREPEILYHLAAAWAADGSPRTAREVLDRAAAMRPTPAVARRIESLQTTLTARLGP